MFADTSLATIRRRGGQLLRLLLLALAMVGAPIRPAGLRPQTARSQAGPGSLYLPLVNVPYKFGPGAANPLNLSVRTDIGRASRAAVGAPSLAPDAARATQAMLPAAGGVITATALDNTLFTLVIPAGALYTTTQITLIPLAAIDGKPLGGNAGAGVKLEPDGLQFYTPVTLTIETTATIPVTAELPLAFQGDGQDFYRYPLARHLRTPTFQLMHFSGVAYLGDGISIPVTPDYPVPTDVEAQLKQEAERLLQNERQAELLGLDPDPNLASKLRELLRSYYNQVLRPEMLASRTICDWAEQGGFQKAFGFERQVQLLGFADDFAAEHDEIWDSLEISLRTCWEKRTKPCVNYNDIQEVAALIRLANEAHLLGLEGFDPFAYPQCDCTGIMEVSGWKGTFHLSWTRSVEGQDSIRPAWYQISVSHKGDFTTLLDFKLDQVFGMRWQNDHWTFANPFVGATELNDHTQAYYTDDPPRTYTYDTTGSGAPESSYAYVDFRQEECTYDLHLWWDLMVDDTNAHREKVLVLSADVLKRNAHVDPQAMVWRGDEYLPVISGLNSTYEHVGFGGVSGSSLIGHLVIPGVDDPVGWARVSWNLEAVP